MKNLALILLLVSLLNAAPTWYHNIEQKTPSSYVGFGSEKSEVAAKHEALSDIASQISVEVDTRFSSHIKDDNGNLSDVSEKSTMQRAKSSIQDYKLLKSEYSDGKYYVSLSYENIPSIDKFIRKVKRSKFFLKEKNGVSNSYLKHSEMASLLKRELHKEIEFALVRKDTKWFIKYENILQVLDKKDFKKFFSSVSNAGLELNTNKRNNILYEGDKFYFKVNATKSGYISILTVYEDGTVSTLVRNIKIDKNKMQNIPDEDFESIAEAGLIESGVETYDLYVAIHSTKKIHFDSYAYADSELVNEEKYKNFDELMEFLDNKHFTTLKVVTKPRH